MSHSVFYSQNMNFNFFYNKLRETEEYDKLIAFKHDNFLTLTSKEYACYLFIHDMLNRKIKVHEIVKLIEPKLHWVIKGTITARFACKKLVTNWSKVDKCLQHVSAYDSHFAHNQFLQFPFGYHVRDNSYLRKKCVV